jgi:hypothetical protein
MLKANVKVSLFRNTLPNYSLTYILGKIKRGTPKPTYIPIRKVNKKRRKYNPKFIKAIQEKANYKTWDELVKEYNIPMGYLLKKGKDKPSDQVIINIDKVIIKG